MSVYSLLFLASVAGLDSRIVQADKTLTVFIGLKTELKRFFCRSRLLLRTVPVRKARIRVCPDIAGRLQKDGPSINEVAAGDLFKKRRCAAEHSRFHVAMECVAAVCSKPVGEHLAATILVWPVVVLTSLIVPSPPVFQ